MIDRMKTYYQNIWVIHICFDMFTLRKTVATNKERHQLQINPLFAFITLQ